MNGIWHRVAPPKMDTLQQLLLAQLSAQEQGKSSVQEAGLIHLLSESTTQTSWEGESALEITATQYMTRYLDNLTYTETTAADFTGVSGNESELDGFRLPTQMVVR